MLYDMWLASTTYLLSWELCDNLSKGITKICQFLKLVNFPFKPYQYNVCTLRTCVLFTIYIRLLMAPNGVLNFTFWFESLCRLNTNFKLFAYIFWECKQRLWWQRHMCTNYHFFLSGILSFLARYSTWY